MTYHSFSDTASILDKLKNRLINFMFIPEQSLKEQQKIMNRRLHFFYRKLLIFLIG